MKKILVLVILAVIVLVPVTAATNNSYALGLNIGTGASLAGQYQMDKFRLNGNLGYGFLGGGFVTVDAWADYRVAEFDIGDIPFWVTAGAGGHAALSFSGGFAFGAAVIAPIGFGYSFDSQDFPIDLYLRFAPGVAILPNLGFHYDVYDGAVWRFD